MRATFLPFSPPSITEAEIEAVVDTLRSGWVTTGPKTKQFEREFAQYIGADAALALNSCTGGLHIALAALGIGPGDEVITSTMTFASTANVIEHVGAKPVLVDVEADLLTMDPCKVEAAITPRTKAIIPVHFGGHPVEMDPILELARQHNFYVIEDAAHSMPALYKGRAVGTIGDFTSFSFYATKNMTTGEGGMLTGSEDLVARARPYSLHGISRDAWKRYSAGGSWYYEVIEAGFKYNMTDIQAALGLVQLKRLETMQQRRYELVRQYQRAFTSLSAVQTPVERPYAQHSWHLYVLRLNLEQLRIDRNQFIHELTEHNIGISVHFIPIHLHPYYRDKYGWGSDAFPVAYGEFQRTISLPLNPVMSDEDAADVIAAVYDIVNANRL
jgi:dTDP-4-amino-4,6-dideoxygalactose transaminase